MFKKGQVNEQFNWIFSLLAGAIILMFFIFVILQIKGVSESKLAVEVINSFDGILAGSEASPNTFNNIDSINSLSFDVDCRIEGLSSYMSILGDDVKIPLGNKIVFSPGIINGKKIKIYNDPIGVPFYVANSLLISDSETIFFFYDPNFSTELNKIYEDFPGNFSPMKFPLIDQSLKSYDRIVVISDSSPDLSDATLDKSWNLIKKKNVNWITIDGLSTTFFKKTKKDRFFENLGTVSLPNQEFLYYLIFSKNLDIYKCNFARITEKTRNIASIYQYKARELYKSKFIQEKCKSQYLIATDYFTQMIGENQGKNFNPIQHSSKSIGEINDVLLKMSCPLLY